MFQFKNYVLEIYQTGSFSQAAANLYISQPSLSTSVKRLEQRIGEPLFDRSMHPICLTECGMEYVRIAQSISMMENEFTDYLEAHRSCQTGLLRIGGSNFNISYVLPSILHDYLRLFPRVQVDITEGNIDQLQQQLGDGKIDFVVDSCEMDQDLFTEYVYKAENLILAVPKFFPCNALLVDYQLTYEDIKSENHLSPEVSVLPLHLLGDTPFIALTPETDTFKRARRICQCAGFSPNTILSFNQQSTAFNMACAGMGSTFISDTLIKNVKYEPNLVYYKVNEDAGYRHIKFYRKKNRKMTYAMKAFISIVQ